jgi:hypothetical protein
MNEITPQENKKEPPKYKKFTIRGYPNLVLAQELADGAATTINPTTKKPFRLGGLKILIKKPNGFDGETQNNTDGIWKYLVYCHKERKAVLKIKEGLKGLG